MKKINLSKNDFSRIILTDVHPYELPFIITNEGFYRKVKNKQTGIFQELFDGESILKPFEFRITKDNDSFRNLSLIHPYSQIEMADFYKKYKDLILYFTSLSRISLRHPDSVSMYYISLEEKNNDNPSYVDESVDIEPNNDEDHSIEDNSSNSYASSFFSYKKFSFLYKFYDSYEMHRLERKFGILCKQDISKCFESINLDAIQCLIRDEESTRKNAIRDSAFEREFTKIMSKLNFGRPSGVVIGPEFSRIFAEIILQQIDCRIVEKLKNNNLTLEKDYSIRRYVDDYFIFGNKEDVISVIEKVIKEELYAVKLFLNQSKREQFKRPFVTGVTKAKIRLRELFDPFASSIAANEDGEIALDRFYSEFNYKKISNDLISKIKIIVSDYDIGYESITGYFFSVIRSIFRKLSDALSHIDTCKNSELLARFLYVLLDLSFFVYSMDKRVRSTFLISQSLIELSKFIGKLSYYSEYLVTSKILSEAKRIAGESPEYLAGVEQLNLAIALSEVQTTNRISSNEMKTLIGINSGKKMNYFQIVVALYVAKDLPDYQEIKTLAFNETLSIVRGFEDNPIDSQKTHLLFDLLTCPYISDEEKYDTLKVAFPSKAIEKISEYFLRLSDNSWFVDWGEISIERLLMKKELRLAY